MFGPLTTECEKVLESYALTKSQDKGHVYI